MKNKVLYIGGFQLPDNNAAAQRVVSNAKALRDVGYDVILVGLKGQGTLVDAPYVCEGFKCYDIPYPANSLKWFDYLTGTKTIKRILNDNGINNFSAVVAYNYPAFALNRLRLFCRAHRVRIFADCTEWYQPDGGVIYKGLKTIDTAVRMRFVHPKLDGIIAISRFLFSFYKPKVSNTILVPPLVDSSMEKWRSSPATTSSQVSLVYAGSPGAGSKDKIDQILAALYRVKTKWNTDFTMTILGLTKEDYFKSFGQKGVPAEIEHSVHFQGRVSHNECLETIKRASYAVFIREINLVTTAGFPTKLVEALTCGTPVLTNQSSNISDYLIEGKNGYILDTSSADTLAESLNFALTKPLDEIDKMKAGLKNRNPFDYRHYRDAFRSLIG